MTEPRAEDDTDLTESEGVETDAAGEEKFTTSMLQKNSEGEVDTLQEDREE